MSFFAPSPEALRALRALVQTSAQFHKSSRHQTIRLHRFRGQRPYQIRFRSEHAHVAQGAESQSLRTSAGAAKLNNTANASTSQWELTVGIEVHAELATSAKLFSRAGTSLTASPNTEASVFDTAFPGAQPQLQSEVLLPALRAALALNCQIQPWSAWDRKHYFWWDQPQGYQITQYYAPFAKDGHIVLLPGVDFDMKAAEALDSTIGIKQVQMEQDTAKTILQPPDTSLLDFNRAGTPLIEIITRPVIKDPKIASAVVKKIQSLLQDVGANTTGMEMGGLRADVNVSVRHVNSAADDGFEYDGVKGLGQRTEIKNLSSFKAVEDAIVAERDRQIEILEAGGKIEGETRGWTLGATTTRRLRGKEGEVDYRYMPDPDLPPLQIGSDLVGEVRKHLPKTQGDWLLKLTSSAKSSESGQFGRIGAISMKDCKTLVSLDGGERLEFFLDTVQLLEKSLQGHSNFNPLFYETGSLVCNWVLMELPTFLASKDLSFPYYYGPNPYPTTSDAPQPENSPRRPVLGSHVLSQIIHRQMTGVITQQSARQLLAHCRVPPPDLPESTASPNTDTTAASEAIDRLIDDLGLRFQPLSDAEYRKLVQEAIASNPDMANKAREEQVKSKKSKKGKMMWFVGQVMKNGEKGRVEAEKAEKYVAEAFAE